MTSSQGSSINSKPHTEASEIVSIMGLKIHEKGWPGFTQGALIEKFFNSVHDLPKMILFGLEESPYIHEEIPYMDPTHLQANQHFSFLVRHGPHNSALLTTDSLGSWNSRAVKSQTKKYFCDEKLEIVAKGDHEFDLSKYSSTNQSSIPFGSMIRKIFRVFHRSGKPIGVSLITYRTNPDFERLSIQSITNYKMKRKITTILESGLDTQSDVMNFINMEVERQREEEEDSFDYDETPSSTSAILDLPSLQLPKFSPNSPKPLKMKEEPRNERKEMNHFISSEGEAEFHSFIHESIHKLPLHLRFRAQADICKYLGEMVENGHSSL